MEFCVSHLTRRFRDNLDQANHSFAFRPQPSSQSLEGLVQLPPDLSSSVAAISLQHCSHHHQMVTLKKIEVDSLGYILPWLYFLTSQQREADKAPSKCLLLTGGAQETESRTLTPPPCRNGNAAPPPAPRAEAVPVERTQKAR